MKTLETPLKINTSLQEALATSDQQLASGHGIPFTPAWMQAVAERAKNNVAQGTLTGSRLALPPSCIN
jgi:ribonucleotide reductase alpha subunit